MSFHPYNTSGGIQTFDRNLKDFFSELDVDFLSVYKAKEQISLNYPCNVFFKGINYLLGYRISSLLLMLFTRKVRNYDYIIINSPSFLRYLDCSKSKVILVQHHDMRTMLDNRSNFNRSSYLVNKVKKDIFAFVFLSENSLRTDNTFRKMRGKRLVIEHVTRVRKLDCKKLKSKNLVMVCRLDNKQKRIDLVIEAMDEMPDWTLNIYGDGNDYKYIEELARKSKHKNIVLHGNTNNVEEALDSSSIHVMSSDYEGFGLSNIEAMRRGLPLIIRNTFSAAQDIIRDNNGVLLSGTWKRKEFVKAVELIYDNYDFFSKNSLAQSERFDFEVNKNKWRKLIGE